VGVRIWVADGSADWGAAVRIRVAGGSADYGVWRACGLGLPAGVRIRVAGGSAGCRRACVRIRVAGP